MSRSSSEVTRVGSDHAWRRTVRAGNVTALLDGTDLRRVRIGAVEIVRRITVAVRDLNWNTVPNAVLDAEFVGKDRGFTFRFAARSCSREIDLTWQAQVTGGEDGTLSYGFDGWAQSDFDYARIGICVLHPPREHAGCAFQAATDRELEGRLPDLVAPQRIVDGIPIALFSPYTRLVMAIRGGGDVTFAFEGDLFEMEDQRNWTDASFKSYSTPFRYGRCHKAEQDQQLSQSVTVSTSGVSERTSARRDPSLSLGASTQVRLPAIGFGASAPGESRPATTIESLRAAAPDHLRVDLDLIGPDWAMQLAEHLAIANDLGCGIELCLFARVTDHAAFDAVASALDPESVERIFVFARDAAPESSSETTPRELMRVARDRLGERFPGLPIGGGTDMYFAELNRTPPAAELMDLVTYAVMPQVHDSDDLSLFESLEGQADTVRSARALAKGRPVAVGPVTLTHRKPFYGDLIASSRSDRRQMAQLLAPWTLGSIRACADAGASVLTYFETVGPRGLLLAEEASQASSTNPGRGRAFPVQAVFRELANHKRASIVECYSTDPEAVVGLALRGDSHVTLLVANLTPERQVVGLATRPKAAAVRAVVGTSSLDCAGARLTLEADAYMVAAVELEMEASRLER